MKKAGRDGAEAQDREMEATCAALEKMERFTQDTLSTFGRELTAPVSDCLQTLDTLATLRPSLRKIKFYKMTRMRLVELRELIENMLLSAKGRRPRIGVQK